MDPAARAPNKKVTRNKRRVLRRRSARDYEDYIVLVDHWEHDYGFGAGHPRFHETPYSYIETLSWTGRVVHPEGFKYPKAVVTLSARKGLMAENSKPETKIGSMIARDQEISADVFIPAEHMSQLVALAASGRLKMIVFVGTPLKRRQGLIRRISLTTENYDAE